MTERHEIRVYSHSTHDMPGICDEAFYVNCDPFVFARRLLLIDEMREEGCDYTRAEVFPRGSANHRDGYRVIRTRKHQRAKASIWGAWRRGVFGTKRRDALLDDLLAAERNKTRARQEALTRLTGEAEPENYTKRFRNKRIEAELERAALARCKHRVYGWARSLGWQGRGAPRERVL